MTEQIDLTLWRTFSRGRRETHSWHSLIDRIGVHDPEIVRSKKTVGGFSIASFEGNRRGLARVEQVHALVLDIDHGEPTLKKIARALKGTQAVAYTTFSHQPDSPRFRAIVPYSRPVDADEHHRVWWAMHTLCGKADLEIDASARDASHLFFLPSRRPEGKYVVRELDGSPLDVDWALGAVKEVPTPLAVPCAKGPVDGTARGGGYRPRDQSASGRDWHLALSLMREGLSDEEVMDELRQVSAKYAKREQRSGYGEAYLEFTVSRAREVHEAYAPVMRLERATLRCLPPRFSYPERRHVELELLSEDGELVRAEVVVPSQWNLNAAKTWEACFPDLDADLFLGDWGDVEDTWRSIRWRNRAFEVALRDGEVRWIRAAAQPR